MIWIAALSTLILASLWGWIEGRWLNRRTKAGAGNVRGHFFLGVGRFLLVLVLVYFIQHAYKLHPSVTVWLIIAAGFLFIPVHRISMNATRHAAFPNIPLWWMGEWDGEGSFYDELWHWIAWRVSGRKREKEKSFDTIVLVYRNKKLPPPEKLPFTLATATEVALALSVFLLILTTNT